MSSPSLNWRTIPPPPSDVLGDKISVTDIDVLKMFKLYEQPEIRVQIEVMKPEVMKYQALA